MTRALILTPQIGGADGVSALGREIVAALRARLGDALESISVSSLHDEAAPEALDDDRRVIFETARGGRAAFAAAALGARGVDAETLVLVLHTHLLPVALPLAARGARVVPLLLGIEAWAPLTRLQRAGMLCAWKVAAISQHTADRFRAANPGLAGVRVDVCHPGVDTTDAPDAPPSPGDAHPFALIVGRMSRAERYKGHDQLLDVWPAVVAAAPDARLVVVGNGDDERRLRGKAAARGLDGIVRFEGRVGDERLADFYRQASIFVMPSRDEGFGLVYLEAMRRGLPCIAGRGAAEEIVEHGVSGLIVQPDDSHALASALVRLFTDPALRTAMGKAARARVRERFARPVFAGRLHALLGLAVPHEAAC